MTKNYSLFLAVAIIIFVIVYAYDPRYVLLYVTLLASMIAMRYMLIQHKEPVESLVHETHG